MCRLLVLPFLTLVATQLVFAQVQTNCPTLDVFPPAGIVQPGEKFVFTGALEGDVPKNLSFQWEVSGGKIVEGQGTLKVSVGAEWSAGGTTITVTLNVLGLPEGCPKSASEAAGVSGPHKPVLIDEFGRVSNDDIRTRLNKFLAELYNKPNNQGYVILYGTAREMTARERLIIKHLTFRDFPSTRTTIVRGDVHPDGKAYTKLYRVPPGADNPVS